VGGWGVVPTPEASTLRGREGRLLCLPGSASSCGNPGAAGRRPGFPTGCGKRVVCGGPELSTPGQIPQPGWAGEGRSSRGGDCVPRGRGRGRSRPRGGLNSQGWADGRCLPIPGAINRYMAMLSLAPETFHPVGRLPGESPKLRTDLHADLRGRLRNCVQICVRVPGVACGVACGSARAARGFARAGFFDPHPPPAPFGSALSRMMESGDGTKPAPQAACIPPSRLKESTRRRNFSRRAKARGRKLWPVFESATSRATILSSRLCTKLSRTLSGDTKAGFPAWRTAAHITCNAKCDSRAGMRVMRMGTVASQLWKHVMCAEILVLCRTFVAMRAGIPVMCSGMRVMRPESFVMRAVAGDCGLFASGPAVLSRARTARKPPPY